MIGLTILISNMSCRSTQENDRTAKPGTELSSLPFVSGYSANVEKRPGVVRFPVESTWYLSLKKHGRAIRKIEKLSDFRNALKIRSSRQALELCRTWTNPHLFWFFDPRALEVRFDPNEKLEGFDAVVRAPNWKPFVMSFPKIKKLPNGFLIERLLVVEKTHLTPRCYFSKETVLEGGHYSVSLKRAKLGNRFDDIAWFLPTVE